MGITLLPEEHLAATGSTNGVIRLWDWKRGVLQREVKAHAKPVATSQALARSSKLIVFYPTEGKLFCWDTRHWQESPVWEWLTNGPALVSADGRWGAAFLTASEEVSLLNLATREQKILDVAEPNDMAFTRDSGLLAVASALGYLRVWELSPWREIAKMGGFLQAANSVGFSPDRRRIVAGGSGKEAVKLYDLESQHEVLNLEATGSVFFNTVFSADGNVLVSRNLGGELHVWRAPSWEEIEAAEKTQAARTDSR